MQQRRGRKRKRCATIRSIQARKANRHFSFCNYEGTGTGGEKKETRIAAEGKKKKEEVRDTTKARKANWRFHAAITKVREQARKKERQSR